MQFFLLTERWKGWNWGYLRGHLNWKWENGIGCNSQTRRAVGVEHNVLSMLYTPFRVVALLATRFVKYVGALRFIDMEVFVREEGITSSACFVG